MKLDDMIDALPEPDKENVLDAGDQIIEAIQERFPDNPNLSYLACLVACDVLKSFVKIVYAVPATATKQ